MALVAVDGAPETFKEALNDPKWTTSMDTEMKGIERNETWKLVPRSEAADKKVVKCRWVYRTKKDGLKKSRLVAKGFSQTHGVDYTETFAPVAKFTSVRALLALAANEDMEIHQMDVIAAFLAGDLKEEVYMEQPEGYEVIGDDGEKMVCKLQKPLYGLKQAPRAWYTRLHVFLLRIGFTRTNADHSIYVNMTTGIILCIYVDDLLLFAHTRDEVERLKRQLSDEFDMKDLGEVERFLGMEVRRDRQRKLISLGQVSYINEILARFGMNDSHAVSTPVALGTKLEPTGGDDEQFDSHTYSSAIGSLMYAMLGTRPDIAYAVSMLSQFSANPSEKHWGAVKRVFRYLRGTSTYTLVYDGKKSVNGIHGYCDSDYAGDIQTRRSTSGYVFLSAGAAISWSSKKQRSVALSTTEAEYVAMSEACKEAIWLQRLMDDLGRKLDGPMLLLSDNQGAIALVRNPEFHQRTKHIDVRHHFIRELVNDEGVINPQYCPTSEMTADGLTKALPRNSHDKGLAGMGLAAQEKFFL
jgi:hypothetical protein